MNTREEVLRRYPRLVAHLICESLGYFSVLSAAGAVQAHLAGEPCFCEWYSHMAGFRPGGATDSNLLAIGAETLDRAFRGRRSHSGYMAEYKQAAMLVRAELERSGCTRGMFASWF